MLVVPMNGDEVEIGGEKKGDHAKYAFRVWALVLSCAVASLSTFVLDDSSLEAFENRRGLQAGNETIFLTTALDEFFRELFGDATAPYDIMAACAIVIGVVYAFFGARLERSTALLAGLAIGGVAAVVVLEVTGAQNDIANGIYVGIFFGSALFVGLLAFCLAGLRKIIFGIAMACLFMAFVIYLGLGELVGNNYIVLGVTVVIGLIFVFLAFKFAGFVVVIVSPLIGGALAILGISHFTKSVVSVNNLVADPENFLLCTTEECLIPMVIGLIVTILGLLFQLRKYCKKKNTAQRVGANPESEALVNEMRQYREGMEQRFAEIDRRHQAELQQVTQAAAQGQHATIRNLQQTVEQQQAQQARGLTLLEEKLVAQERALAEEQRRAAEAEERARLEQERRFEAEQNATMQAQGPSAEQQLLLERLAAEKEELEAQLAAEREKELALQEEERARDTRERAKENEETDLVQGTALVGLQGELEDTHERIRNFEAQIKETTQQEKKIRPPKIGDDEGDDDEHPVLQEVRERAAEFTKMRALVIKARQEQKSALKQAKKALGQAQSLSNDIEKTRRKTAKRAKTEEDIARQQTQMNELIVRMERAQQLVGRYEDYSGAYQTLVQDLLRVMEEFKVAEKRVEAYDQYDLQNNVQEGIALDEDEDEDDEEAEVIQARDLVAGRVVRQPSRGPNGEVRVLSDDQIDFSLLITEFGKFIRNKFGFGGNRPR